MGSVFGPVVVKGATNCIGGSIAWQYRGRVQITVLVKATFAIAPDGSLRPAAPEPLHMQDEPDPARPGRALTPSEYVPYRPKIDVVVRTGAHAPTVRARLSVSREGTSLLDKTSDAGPAAFGPLLTGLPLGALQGAEGVLHVPDDFQWPFFQAAPPDQQIDFLRGDELVRITHEGRDLSIRAPVLEGVIEARGLEGYGDAALQADLQYDHLIVDLDRARLTLVARTSFDLENGESPASIRVVADVRTSAPLPPAPMLGLGGTVPLVDPGFGGDAPMALPPLFFSAASSGTVMLDPPNPHHTLALPEGSPPEAWAPFALAQPSDAGKPATPIPGAPWAAEPAPTISRPLSGESTLFQTIAEPPTAEPESRAAPTPAPEVSAPPPMAEVWAAPEPAPRTDVPAAPAAAPVAKPVLLDALYAGFRRTKKR